MPDVTKILRLVEEGALTPDEADQILAALDSEPAGQPLSAQPAGPQSGTAGGPARHLRIEITDNGRKVVNLRVPINIASFAAGIVPGLSDTDAERIRQSVHAGVRGALVDITSDDGSRVLIVSE
ncbi:hypothetical protein BH23CHL7_BH23CHL7_12950 [soil metagenome]